jgi:UDP-GlcNAc:undecaprenyl-phosphate GlcNAc-1-phosphate transferase
MDPVHVVVWLLVVGAMVGVIGLLEPICRHYNLLDHPDERKQHGESVPLAGGLALMLVVAPSMLGAAVVERISFHPSWWVAMGTGMALLAIGTIDDRRGLSPRVRLIVQIIAALTLVYLGNFRVTSLGTLGELGWTSVPFTVLAIVAFLNACNMVDGSDGLLGAVLLPAMVAIAALATAPLSWGAGILAAGVCGFLLFNWPLASGRRRNHRIFLGNGGVLFIALLSAALLVRATGGGGPLFPGSVPWLVMIPLIELATTCVRRIVHRMSPMSADRGHLHHRLLKRGVSPAALARGYLWVSVVLTIIGVLVPLFKVDGIFLWAGAATILTGATVVELLASMRSRAVSVSGLQDAQDFPCARRPCENAPEELRRNLQT